MTARQYTDGENTGAPIVPLVEKPTDIKADGGEEDQREYLEEMVWSHYVD
ncbi:MULTISPECIES: hypothetical protein [unclassified Haladaptatus]|nr:MULTISPECIES: hypothetical protein [unclassified Haladaptatus]